MLQRPQFRQHVHPEYVPGEGVFLLSETGTVILHGHLPQLVAPLVDGVRSPDDIVDLLADRASPAEVYYGLLELERQGHLVEGATPADRGQAAWWSIQGIDPPAASRRIEESRIAVASLGDLPTEPMRSALQ